MSLKTLNSKKWTAATFAGTITTLVLFVLNALGITAIPQETIYPMILMVVSMFVTGAANKHSKRKAETEQKKIIIHDDVKSFSGDGWFSVAEFKKSATHGNVIEHGTKLLTISSDKVRSYLTVILRDANQNVLMIDQGSAGKPCRLKLADRTGKDLPKGNYSLVVQGDYGSSDAVRVTDQFSIN